jgi:hypothetical protein
MKANVCYWPNSVSREQQTGQLYPARVVNPIGIRIQGGYGHGFIFEIVTSSSSVSMRNYGRF